MPASRAHLITAALLLAGVLSPFSLAQTPTPAERPKPAELWDSRGCIDDARGEWFRDAKFGAIIHFGPYSHLGGSFEDKTYVPSEQIIGLGQRHAAIPCDQYRAKVAGAFNPAKFDAAQWVSLMKNAGQKYVILTTKHHDGFCMFKTATTSYNIVEATPFGRDVVKELAEECRKQGLVFCVYYSIGDWCAADVQGARYSTYQDYMFAQLRELLTNYGEIKLLWFDNWWYVNDQWANDLNHARRLYSFARAVNPNILINDRCGEGVRSDHGDYATPENQLKGSLQSRYFEVVMTNTQDENWGWVRGVDNYRTPTEIIRNLIDSVSKGGNFVLNVGPTETGEFPPQHVALLEGIGAWTTVNGESIYGCRPAPDVNVTPSEGVRAYVTRSKFGTDTFIHILSWPTTGEPVEVRLTGVRNLTATLLDPSLGKLQSDLSHAEADTLVRIHAPDKPDSIATVIKLTHRPSPESPRP